MKLEFAYSPKLNLAGIGISFDWEYKLLTFAFLILFIEIDFRKDKL